MHALQSEQNIIPMPQQANTDEQLVTLWLGTKTVLTAEAYARNISEFFAYVRLPVRETRLAELQRWHLYIMSQPLAERTKAQRIASVRDFFSFAKEIGYINFNPANLIKPPRIKDDLAERILTPEQVEVIITGEKNPRNKAILTLLYNAALRVSELCALKWKDIQPGGHKGFAGQVTIFGKGGKTNVVKLTQNPWDAITSLKNGAGNEDPVFVSRKNGHLSRSQVMRIVREAGKRAGIEGNVSPHWFRHSHASHAIEAGASLALVKATLGHASVASTNRYLHARPEDSSGRYLKEI